MHASQLFAWRRELRVGIGGAERAEFAPVIVAPPPSQSEPEAGTGGRMEIVLCSGRRIIVDDTVDAAALDRAVTVLDRR